MLGELTTALFNMEIQMDCFQLDLTILYIGVAIRLLILGKCLVNYAGGFISSVN